MNSKTCRALFVCSALALPLPSSLHAQARSHLRFAADRDSYQGERDQRENRRGDGEDHRGRDDRGDRDRDDRDSCPTRESREDHPRLQSLYLDTSQTASSTWSNGTLALSFAIANRGSHRVNDVVIDRIRSKDGQYTGPSALPIAVGSIDAFDSQNLSPLFTPLQPTFTTPFAVTLAGTYRRGEHRCSFRVEGAIPPPAPSNAGTPKHATTVPVQNASNSVYLAAQPHPGDDARNAESTFFPPLGQPRYLFPTPPAFSSLNLTKAFSPDPASPPPGSNANDVVFVRNSNGGTYSALPPDPNATGPDTSGFALISANNNNGGNAASVSYSKDFGSTFTTVNLTSGTGFSDPSNPTRTDFFPENDGGLCCDQVVHYIPGRNLVVWLLQYWSPAVNIGGLPQKGTNRLRIAFATPQAAAADFLHAWSWFDISPATLGDNTATDWMDYPDLSYSNGSLYISVDHGFWNGNTNPKTGNVIGQQVNTDRRWFIRASLDDMAGGKSSVGLSYYEPVKSGLYKSHFVQSAPDTMYYAAEPDTSTLTVFADPDSAGTVPSGKDVGITSRCSSAATNPCVYTATAADNLNWNVAPHAVLGGAYVAPSFFCPPTGCTGPTHFLYFALDGGIDTANNRPFTYVRVEKIDADALNRISELDIWNPAFTFSTPALNWRPNSGKDEVAISLATDSGGYANDAVGFLGDFVAYVTTASNATQTDVNSNVRYGDYFSVRNAISPPSQYGTGLGFSTLGYAVNQAVAGKTCAVGGCNVKLQFVLFGRSGDLFPSPPPVVK